MTTTGLSRIVVATDFGPGAERALARAAVLPLAPNASVIALHVSPEGTGPAIDRQAKDGLARALASLAAASARTRTPAEGAGIVFDAAHRRGKPFVEIVRFAREVGADLVVIGRHRRRSIRDLFLGSTAERVIRKGDVPVLLVNREPRGPYRRPLVALDLADASYRALELMLRVIDPEARVIEAVHAYEAPLEHMLLRADTPIREVRRMRDQERRAARAELQRVLALATKGRRFRIFLRHGDPRAAIRAEAARRRSDLVAVGTHGRTGIEHILIGSVAESAIRELRCDVLVARPARWAFTLP